MKPGEPDKGRSRRIQDGMLPGPFHMEGAIWQFDLPRCNNKK